MRHAMITVLAAALLTAITGCKPKPKDQRMTVEQTEPFRTEEEFATKAEATEPEMVPVDLVGADAGTKDEGADPNTATEPPAARTHVIVKGDTLYSLARRYLGHGRRWKEIQAANPRLNPKKLRIGQEIVIPAE